MIIRKANENDAKEIVLLNIRSWQDTYQDIFPKEYLDNLDKLQEESIIKTKQKINEYIVCYIDNKLVGFARFGLNKKGYDNNYGEIYALYVDYNYQHQSIGSSLAKVAFRYLSQDYKYVLISTLKENSANAFYQKIGGKLICESKFVLNDNEYAENVYLFTCDFFK